MTTLSGLASRKARKGIRPHRLSIARRIYDWVAEHKVMGATCQEVETNLGLKHQTASPRLSELVAANLLKPSPHTRNGCVVYYADGSVPWSSYAATGRASKAAKQPPDGAPTWEQQVLEAARAYRANPCLDTSYQLMETVKNG